MSNLFQGKILPLGPAVHNTARVPIVIAVQIDHNIELVGGGTSCYGGMAKGKGDGLEERTDGTM